MRVMELPTEEFFKKFQNYINFFDGDLEDFEIEDDERGIWIHAIIKNDANLTDELFVQAWDYGSSDPKCFVYFSKDRIYIGTCECNLSPDELFQLVRKVLESEL